MVQYITTPWRSHSSLLAVRDALYPSPTSPLSPEETASQRREAIARVSIWAQRGNCPHLVESTALLSAAILNDDPRNGTWCIRAAYASSFSRFVTGLLDSHQTAKRKISMYALAKTLDLPATYVELRHQATHEELPSLQKLRVAARKALQWIWDRYWVDLSQPEEAAEAEGDEKEWVKRAVREGSDGRRREELERRLQGGEFGAERVLEALMDAQEEDDGERDSEVLLRALRLSRRVLGGDKNPEMGEKGPRSIEDVRRELTKAKENLDEEIDEEVQGEIEEAQATDEQGKGWAMWEGPWTPIPIGTVRY